MTTRRRLLQAAPAAALLAACGRARAPEPRTNGPTGPGEQGSASHDGSVAPPASPSPTPSPTPSPAPVPPAGRAERLLLAGTPWETRAVVTQSGVAGRVVLVLAGVHGNEPGGWIAADEVATWTPAAGALAVVPRANGEAIAAFVRTSPELGDLNRLYPGNPEGPLPMERMAAAIVALARELRASVVLDLHESWAFYAGRPQEGTAFLGQTVTAGVGPRNPSLAQMLVERVNADISIERDRLILRDGTAFRRQDAAGPAAPVSAGRSSLALGGFVAGLTPVLVEMGQEGQAVERRRDLHLAVVRAALSELGMV